MIQLKSLPELALMTLKNPEAASATVLSWNMPKEAIWTAIALVSVIVTILSTLSNMIFPVPPPLDGIVSNPFMYFVIAAGGFIATVYSVYWAGRLFGAQGQVEDLMVLLLWLQALRAAAQVFVLFLLVMAPVAASFFVLFVAVATIWVFVHFINAGLKLNSILRAVGVLLVGALGMVIVMTVLLSFLGVSAVGVPVNV